MHMSVNCNDMHELLTKYIQHWKSVVRLYKLAHFTVEQLHAYY